MPRLHASRKSGFKRSHAFTTGGAAPAAAAQYFDKSSFVRSVDPWPSGRRERDRRGVCGRRSGGGVGAAS
jgi:hypothetical protein